jgi:hypothetical protein
MLGKVATNTKQAAIDFLNKAEAPSESDHRGYGTNQMLRKS